MKDDIDKPYTPFSDRVKAFYAWQDAERTKTTADLAAPTTSYDVEKAKEYARAEAQSKRRHQARLDKQHKKRLGQINRQNAQHRRGYPAITIHDNAASESEVGFYLEHRDSGFASFQNMGRSLSGQYHTYYDLHTAPMQGRGFGSKVYDDEQYAKIRASTSREENLQQLTTPQLDGFFPKFDLDAPHGRTTTFFDTETDDLGNILTIAGYQVALNLKTLQFERLESDKGFFRAYAPPNAKISSMTQSKHKLSLDILKAFRKKHNIDYSLTWNKDELEAFQDYARGTIYAGQNIEKADLPWMLRPTGRDFNVDTTTLDYLDTFHYFKALTGAKSAALSDLVKGLPPSVAKPLSSQSHNAAFDVVANIKVMEAFLKEGIAKNDPYTAEMLYALRKFGVQTHRLDSVNLAEGRGALIEGHKGKPLPGLPYKGALKTFNGILGAHAPEEVIVNDIASALGISAEDIAEGRISADYLANEYGDSTMSEANGWFDAQALAAELKHSVQQMKGWASNVQAMASANTMQDAATRSIVKRLAAMLPPGSGRDWDTYSNKEPYALPLKGDKLEAFYAASIQGMKDAGYSPEAIYGNTAQIKQLRQMQASDRDIFNRSDLNGMGEVRERLIRNALATAYVDSAKQQHRLQLQSMKMLYKDRKDWSGYTWYNKLRDMSPDDISETDIIDYEEGKKHQLELQKEEEAAKKMAEQEELARIKKLQQEEIEAQRAEANRAYRREYYQKYDIAAMNMKEGRQAFKDDFEITSKKTLRDYKDLHYVEAGKDSYFAKGTRLDKYTTSEKQAMLDASQLGADAYRATKSKIDARIKDREQAQESLRTLNKFGLSGYDIEGLHDAASKGSEAYAKQLQVINKRYHEGYMVMKRFSTGLTDFKGVLSAIGTQYNSITSAGISLLPSLARPTTSSLAKAGGNLLEIATSARLFKNSIRSQLFGIGEGVGASLATVGPTIATKAVGLGIMGLSAAVGNIASAGEKGQVAGITRIGQTITARLNILSASLQLATLPLKAFAKGIRGITGLFGRLGNIWGSSVGFPLTHLTGVTSPQYSNMQGSDVLLGFKQGTLNSLANSWSSAQVSLYGLGKYDENRLVASALLGVFGDVYSPMGGDATKQMASAVNHTLGLIKKDPSRADYYIGISEIINKELPNILQTMLDLGIDDYTEFTDGRLRQKEGVWRVPLSQKERTRMRRMEYGWSESILGLNDNLRRLATPLWETFGKSTMNSINKALYAASTGDWSQVTNIWEDWKKTMAKGAKELGLDKVWDDLKGKLQKGVVNVFADLAIWVAKSMGEVVKAFSEPIAILWNNLKDIRFDPDKIVDFIKGRATLGDIIYSTSGRTQKALASVEASEWNWEKTRNPIAQEYQRQKTGEGSQWTNIFPSLKGYQLSGEYDENRLNQVVAAVNTDPSLHNALEDLKQDPMSTVAFLEKMVPGLKILNPDGKSGYELSASLLRQNTDDLMNNAVVPALEASRKAALNAIDSGALSKAADSAKESITEIAKALGDRKILIQVNSNSTGVEAYVQQNAAGGY
jgi:hypothetical protein